MAKGHGIDNQVERASRNVLGNRCFSLGIAVIVLLAGCTADRAQSNAMSPTSRPIDVACPHCAMKHYVWDSRGRRSGKVTHHDIWSMECSDCEVRMSGIWLLLGPTHTCCDCPAGVERCPMCRAADRGDGKYPTTLPSR